MHWRELQKQFSQSIREKKTGSFLGGVIPGGKLPHAEDALLVYQKGYPARLTEALGETYEAVWRVLGDEAFFQICEDYLYQNPSQSYSLSDYGETFPDFLKDHEVEFLSDLAQLEWNFKEVFHSKPETLSPVSILNEDTRFSFPSSLRFLSSEFSILEIWKKREEDEPGELHWENPEFLTLFKNENGKIWISSWKKWEFEILQNLAQGKSLGEALSREDLPSEEGVSLFFGKISEIGLINGLIKGGES